MLCSMPIVSFIMSTECEDCDEALVFCENCENKRCCQECLCEDLKVRYLGKYFKSNNPINAKTLIVAVRQPYLIGAISVTHSTGVRVKSILQLARAYNCTIEYCALVPTSLLLQHSFYPFLDSELIAI